jgi:hypothetical protein
MTKLPRWRKVFTWIPQKLLDESRDGESLNSEKGGHPVWPGRRSYELRRLPSTHSSTVSRTVLALYHA